MTFSQKTKWIGILLSACFALASPIDAQPNAPFQDPGKDYQLSPQDEIAISVYGEPDLSVTRRIDAAGRVSLPLLGDVTIAGHTSRSAEDFLEKRFIEEEFLINPQVAVSIVQYNLRQFYIFGQVQSPGAKPFPIEAEYLDIIDAISRAGDFTDIARRSAIRVTRSDEEGKETVLNWNLDGLIQGSGNFEKNRDKYRVYPGDVIFVPERIF